MKTYGVGAILTAGQEATEVIAGYPGCAGLRQDICLDLGGKPITILPFSFASLQQEVEFITFFPEKSNQKRCTMLKVPPHRITEPGGVGVNLKPPSDPRPVGRARKGNRTGMLGLISIPN